MDKKSDNETETETEDKTLMISEIEEMISERKDSSTIVTRVDAATSPTMFSSKSRRGSHVRGGFSFHSRRDTLVRLPSSRNRSRAFSVASIQSYLYFFWPSMGGIEDLDEELFECEGLDEDFEEDTLEPGCCNACRDKDIPWFKFYPPSTSVKSDNFKFQLFGGIFCLLGAATFSLQQLGEDLLDPSGFTSLLGGTTYLLAGFATILALWKRAKITLFVQLIFSILSLLHSLIWILAFQVILAIKIETVNKLGKEMDHGFPWVLAAKYFMSGIGCVIGILSAAMASFAMRELKESLEEKTFLPVRKISNLSTTQIEHQPSRKTSHVPVIIEEPSNLHIIEERPLQQLVSITECTSNGIIETSFP